MNIVFWCTAAAPWLQDLFSQKKYLCKKSKKKKVKCCSVTAWYDSSVLHTYRASAFKRNLERGHPLKLERYRED